MSFPLLHLVTNVDAVPFGKSSEHRGDGAPGGGGVQRASRGGELILFCLNLPDHLSFLCNRVLELFEDS